MAPFLIMSFLVSNKEIEKYSSTFSWQTMTGEVLTLDQMSDRHQFNCLKMLYNHIAKQYGLPTVWFNHEYENYLDMAQLIPKDLALQMCVFIHSIEVRGTLPQKYWEPYEQILMALQNLKVAKLESKLLPATKQ